MMDFWRTRYTRPASLAPGLATSTAAHAILVGAAVAVTQPDPNRPAPEVPPNSIARFLAPPDRTPGQHAQRERIRYVALAVPDGIVAPDAKVDVVQSAEPRASGLDQADAPALQELSGVDSVFSQIQVDSAASRYEWSAAPAFPPAMLAKNQGGFVRAEWVVDETGVVDTSTFRIVESTHPEFTKAVRDALPYMRFRPARIGDRAVRQLVQQPFYFQVTTAGADSGTARKPVS